MTSVDGQLIFNNVRLSSARPSPDWPGSVMDDHARGSALSNRPSGFLTFDTDPHLLPVLFQVPRVEAAAAQEA